MSSAESGGNLEELLEINISTLNKPQLLIKAKELQDALKIKKENGNVEYIMKRLDALEKKQSDNEFEIRTLRNENKKLKRRIKENEGDMDDVDERIIQLEKTVNNVDQYIRRENFEISGISESIKQENLEDKVIDIINEISTTEITAKDIEACHRLKKDRDGPAKVIVRMVNRKHSTDIMKNRKKLKDKAQRLGSNFYINENLSDDTKKMFDTARELKKNGYLFSCWTFNGKVNIKLRENDNKLIKILHMSEYEDYFSPLQLGWV